MLELALLSPLAIPIGMVAVYYADDLKRMRLPRVKLRLKRAGRAQPTTVLAEMIALHVLRELPSVALVGRKQSFRVKGLRVSFSTDYYRNRAPDRFKIATSLCGYANWLKVFDLTVTSDVEVSLTDGEKRIIGAAIAKAFVLRRFRENLTEEQQRQNIALNAIERIVGTSQESSVASTA